MSKIKDLLFDIEEDVIEGKLTLAEIAKKYDVRYGMVLEVYEQTLENNELLRQYEAMSYSAELENFSPFDTVNS